jgi:hypothetical protein
MSRRSLPRWPLLIAAAALMLLAAAPAQARVLDVTKRRVAFSHFTTIQSAVNAARSGDWIVIDRGVYPESVLIQKSNLHLRGLDRNRVIVDGRHRKSVNGIEILKANNVWVENLTVRNFDRPTKDGANGNQIWWNGGDGSGRIGARGWYGQYLTAYDTGLTGGYGLFASNTVRGFLRHVYASGFADSGIYIGACPDCQALVDDALVERNALGYSGTNSGGHLVVQNSRFRNNTFGVAPNSLNNDDKPPPQDGSCASARHPKITPGHLTNLPTFSSTQIARCTIFRNNLIENNNNLNAPESGGTDGSWGVGVLLPGDYADLVQGNVIRNNVNFGVLVHEYPNPFPPTSNTVYFQASGNKVANNRLTNNGTRSGGANLGLEGGVFGSMQSVNNCFSGNRFSTSIPANIQGTWGCQNRTTPNGGSALLGKLIQLLGETSPGDPTYLRHPRGQRAPGRQPSMPRPCGGVPRNGHLC